MLKGGKNVFRNFQIKRRQHLGIESPEEMVSLGMVQPGCLTSKFVNGAARGASR